MNRRAFFVLIFLTFLIFGIIFRLAWIQIFATRAFSYKKVDLVTKAVEQRREKIVLDTGRGTMYDRNGISLLGKEVTGLAIFPTAHAQLKKAGKLEKLVEILDVPKETLNEQLNKMKHADFWRDEQGKIVPLDDTKIKKVNELNVIGLMALPVVERYEKEQVARQVIGYIGYKENAEKITEKVGIAGLEESFQPFLNSIGEKSVSFFVDGRGRPLYGLNVKKQEQQDNFYPLSIKTTLDASIQKVAEDAFNASGIQEGAGVILDVNTREVLAMVSRPAFTPENEEMRRNPQLFQKGLENRGLTRMTPGSVFKIVVAAAALEEGIVKPGDHFHCEEHYGKYGFTCWKEGGHGDITFAEAFAQSCNITFAEVAKKVGAKKIIEYAGRLGLTETIGWKKDPFQKLGAFYHFSREQKGQIFTSQSQQNDEGVLIQTAIGQRDVQITPLTAAAMVAMIAGDGKAREVRVVDSIQYKNGTNFYTFEDHEMPATALKPQTLKVLRQLMGGVVENGTAQSLSSLPWKVAGKTGTAQIGNEKYNLWFAGYAPAEKPRYAIAVVAQNLSNSNSKPVLKVTGDIIQGLNKMVK